MTRWSRTLRQYHQWARRLHPRSARVGHLGLVMLLLLLGLGLTSQMVSRSTQAAPTTNPHRTIYVHYDYMVAPDHSDAPDPAGIQLVVDAFARHGIALVIDPEHTAIPEHKVITFHTTLDPRCAGPDAVDFFALKQQYFHQTHPVEHYAIFGYYSGTDSFDDFQNCRQFPTDGIVDLPQPCQSGMSELPGANFVISLGCARWDDLNFPDVFPIPQRLWTLAEAGIFMHELGHNLGLHHGGDDDISYKPNYLSVMNYSYQFGIGRADQLGSNVGDPALTYLDYSEQVLPKGGNTPGYLDSANLNELAGLGSGTADLFSYTDTHCGPHTAASNGPVDWNGDGSIDSFHASANLNYLNQIIESFYTDFTCHQPPKQVLMKGFDDWAEIRALLDLGKAPKPQQVEADTAPLSSLPDSTGGFKPAITRLSPSSGPVGAIITIKGRDLDHTSRVRFTGQRDWSERFTLQPDGSVMVTVPSDAQNGPISLFTAEGTVTSKQSFTLLTPTVTGFSPTSGPVGTQVTITGTALNGVSDVRGFLIVTPSTSTRITVVVDPGMQSGPIQLQTYNSLITTAQSFTVTPTPPPTITNLSPTSGPAGTLLTISGTNLSVPNLPPSAQYITIGFGDTCASTTDPSSPAPVLIHTDGSLSVPVPACAQSGPITVTAFNGSVTSTQRLTFLPTPPPVITGFAPASAAIGATITITGTNLVDASGQTVVYFNNPNDPAAGTQATTNTDGSLSVVVPAGARSGLLYLYTPFTGATTSGQNFTLLTTITLTSLTPSSGPVGTKVTVTGAGSTDVTFTGCTASDAPAPVYSSGTGSLTLGVPPCAKTGPFIVTAPDGTTFTSTQSFTVTATSPPTLTSFTPASGPVSTTITISGANLDPGGFGYLDKVTIGLVSLRPIVDQEGNLLVTLPARAASGSITVTTPFGSITSAGSFTVTPIPPPTLTSFTPTTGFVSDMLTITGTNLIPGYTEVSFTGTPLYDGSPCHTNPFGIRPDGKSAQVYVPSCAQEGPITIVTPGGTTTSTQRLTLIAPAPVILLFTPATGPVTSEVTFIGRNLFLSVFTPTEFRFTGTNPDGSPCTSGSTFITYLVVDNVQFIGLTAVVPACAQTGPITAVNRGGAQTTTTQSFTVRPVQPPTITLISNDGPVGGLINVLGTDLIPGHTDVLFTGTHADGSACVGAPSSDSRYNALGVTVPSCAETGPITVVNAAGSATSTQIFTVTVTPTITSFTPTQGPIGTKVVITGTHLTATEVLFTSDALFCRGTLTNYPNDTDTTLTISVPICAKTGPLTVHNSAGSATSTQDFTVTS
jgi:hypothetical protein